MKWIPVVLELKACHLGGLLLGGFCLDDDGFRTADDGLAGSRSTQCFWGRTVLRHRPENPRGPLSRVDVGEDPHRWAST